MNPLSNVKAITRMNKLELELGTPAKSSWHKKYKDSAWIFAGGLPFDLTEGDIVCVFSQYGEVVNINLVRDKTNGKSKGYCFICYEDQRSTILAVDNFNGMKLLTRIIRVDHVANYQQAKGRENDDEITKKVRAEGIAPKLSPSGSENEEEDYIESSKKLKKEKKSRKKEGKEKKKKRKDSVERMDVEEAIKSEKIKSELKNHRNRDMELPPKAYRSNEPEDRHTQIKNYDYNEVKDDKNRGRDERTARSRNDSYYSDKIYNRREEENSFKNRTNPRDFKRFRDPPRDAEINRGYNRERDWDRNWERGREFNRDRSRDYDRKRMKW